MAEPPFFSSQSSQYEQHQVLTDQENLDSSPLKRHSSPALTLGGQKPKRLPTVTPKRFTKFFTPRTTFSTRGGTRSKAARQLRDITKNGSNRGRDRGLFQTFGPALPDDDAPSGRPYKRRRHSVDTPSSPPLSSPLKYVQSSRQVEVFEDPAPTSPITSCGDDLSSLMEDLHSFPQPIRRLRPTGNSRKILDRTCGGYDALTRGWRGADSCIDWRTQTADFVSIPTDVHAFSGTALPFCTAACNTNSLIAVGEEEGSVKIIDSAPCSDFNTAHVAFRPHHNAIMDLTFSSDDYRLATASGDQTARIIDMQTQQTMCILSGHKSSVKQIHFQATDDNMLTTSSRDGCVQIWDLRCGGIGSIQSLRPSVARQAATEDIEPAVRYAKHALDVGSAYRPSRGAKPQTMASISETSGVSITAIQQLRDGREHLLLTSSEVNASLKLWDLRNAGRRGASTPISSTPIPESHSRTRNFGVNAMALSSDGGRVYATCRDSIVYVYSTNHLVLGLAPEMASSVGKARVLKEPNPGLGPLYGFRHPLLRTGTFYVKSALRTLNRDKSETLAVSSSDDAVILFPTDERHLPFRDFHAEAERVDEDEEESELSSLPAPLGQRLKANLVGDMPVYEHGTALIRGHTKEVTSLSWTHDGDLVSVSDDFTARTWREDGGKARELRSCGEGGGRRWGCGWADVDAEWDEEDG